MTSIWGFLLQTIQVSLIAGILIIMKFLLYDKLSPRWQYGVWSILFLSILIPAGLFHRYLFADLNVIVETCKTMVERTLDSCYIQAYEVIQNHTVLPWITMFPQSIMDWLFVLYIIIAAGSMLYYLGNYVRLRHVIKKQSFYDERFEDAMIRVSDTYHLPKCSYVMISGLPSPFVFGIIKPILVLPDDGSMDDKILMHELLHVKYKDTLQSVVWTLLKCLHWCNPFLWFVFHMINSDMESLCDQRVLELLQGEERRDYGRILLAMTNEKYPYAFGTSSISNGGKQIKKRIEAIARFKKYPRGMALVSICIVILLLPLAFGGTSEMTFSHQNIEADKNSFSYEKAMAEGRMVRCTTIAGAIDVYAKGLLSGNEEYLVAVMSPLRQQQYERELAKERYDVSSYNDSALYYVTGLKQRDEEHYEAVLVFENAVMMYGEEENDMILYLVPVSLSYEEGSWRIMRTGDTEEIRIAAEDYHMHMSDTISYSSKEACETGTIRLDIQDAYYVENESDTTDEFFGFGNKTYSLKADPAAQFVSYEAYIDVTYEADPLMDIQQIAMAVEALEDRSDTPDFDSITKDMADYEIKGSYSGDYGGGFFDVSSIDDWNGTYTASQIQTYFSDGNLDSMLPQAYAVRLWINEKVVDTITIDVKEDAR